MFFFLVTLHLMWTLSASGNLKAWKKAYVMTVARSSEPRAFKKRLIIFGLRTQPNSSLSWIVWPPPSEATHDFTRMSNSPFFVFKNGKRKIEKLLECLFIEIIHENAKSTFDFDGSLVTSVIIYGDDQGQCRTQWNDSRNWRRPRSLSMLNFHPAIHIVTWINYFSDSLIIKFNEEYWFDFFNF